MPYDAHTCPGITRRLCGWLQGASGTHPIFESSEALADQSSRQCGAHTAVELALYWRSSVNILTAWPGRIAQAPRAGRARAPWSCSVPAHHIGACLENRTVEGSARARRRSKRTRESPARGGGWCHRQRRVPGGTSVGDLPAICQLPAAARSPLSSVLCPASLQNEPSPHGDACGAKHYFIGAAAARLHQQGVQGSTLKP